MRALYFTPTSPYPVSPSLAKPPHSGLTLPFVQGGETALMAAAENGRLECLDHLIAIHLEKKANLNAQVPAG